MRVFARLLVVGVLAVATASPALALVYQVNGASASCSDAGAGTLAQPFCTIGRGAAAAVAGDTVNVASGVYREQVTLPTSGAAGLPITFHAATGARVLGTNDLSGAALWTLESGSTTLYSTPFNPASATAQVFVDGARLAGPVASSSAVVSNSFYFDDPNNRLYVDIGGGNPGNRAVEAGARTYGFLVSGKTDLVIDGFEVYGHNTDAIRVQTVSRVTLRNNRLLASASSVLVVQGTTAPTTTDHVTVLNNEVAFGLVTGIRMRNHVTLSLVQGNLVHDNGDNGLDASDTTNSRFSGNRFYANAKVGGGYATGMRLVTGSHDNQIDRNIAHDNQDTGFQTSGGSNDRNLFVRNLSYSNQDHGFDIRECDSPRVISNTSADNVNDGISVEGNVTNAYLRNNLAAENGIFTGGNELWVDTTSTAGFSSDYDVLYRSSAPGTTIEYGGAAYASVADFKKATGNETRGSGANPNFANLGADDFHPGAGPAIDAADASASGFEALDLDGLPPIDQPGVADTGAGVPTYADRGALEAVGPGATTSSTTTTTGPATTTTSTSTTTTTTLPLDAVPVANLTLTPRKPRVGQVVTADASASSDDKGIVSYRFAWGDGQVTTQAGPIATHGYASSGNKKVVLTVTDTAGQTATKQAVVQVSL